MNKLPIPCVKDLTRKELDELFIHGLSEIDAGDSYTLEAIEKEIHDKYGFKIYMNPEYEVVISSTIKRELDAIQEYGVSRYALSEIFKALQGFKSFPTIYSIPGSEIGMRICPADNYLIAYHVNEENHLVRVSHIIYCDEIID